MAKADFLKKRSEEFFDNAKNLLEKGKFAIAAFNFDQAGQEAPQNPLILTSQNPIVIFSIKPGNKTAKLKVTDSDGLFCDKTKTVITTTALPRWREVIPW